METNTQIEMYSSVSSALGESPIWVARENSIYWIDIIGRKLHSRRWSKDEVLTKEFKTQLSCIVPRERGGFVLATEDGLSFWDANSDQPEVFAHPEIGLPNNRYNDGACDPQGRFWIGSMDKGEKDASGRLYRTDSNLSVHEVAEGYVVTNGLGWSKDSRHMFVTDSANREILISDFDPNSGIPSNSRVFASIGEQDGFPDGLTIDDNDNVWSAHWDGGKLSRYAPDGTVNLIVEMPIFCPTSCTYGGPNLNYLFITTAESPPPYGSSKKMGGQLYIGNIGVCGKEDKNFIG